MSGVKKKMPWESNLQVQTEEKKPWEKEYDTKKKKDVSKSLPVETDLESPSDPTSLVIKKSEIEGGKIISKDYGLGILNTPPPTEKQKLQQVYNEYEKTKLVSEDYKKQVIEDVEADANDTGVWNAVRTVAGKIVNPVYRVFTEWNEPVEGEKRPELIDSDPLEAEKKEARKVLQQESTLAKQSGDLVPQITPELITKKAKEIAISKRIKSKSDSQVRELLETYDDYHPEKQDALIKYTDLKKKSLSDKDKLVLGQQNITRGQADASFETLTSYKNEALEMRRKGIEIPKDFQEKVEAEIVKYNSAVTSTLKLQEEYTANTEELGTLEDNLDIFKRDYGWASNFIGNLGAASADIVSGLFGAGDYALNVKSSILPDAIKPLSDALDRPARKFLKESADRAKKGGDYEREKIQKPISVDDMHNASDVGDWFFHNLVANQAPILGLTMTGAGGIAVLGASATGKKYEQMVDEMDPSKMQEGQIPANYSDSDLALAPAIFGATETASATVDKFLMGNATRVLRSASTVERQMISESFGRQILNSVANTTKKSLESGTIEMMDESITEISQNITDKVLLGKDIVIGENLKDVGAMGFVMGAMLPLGAGGRQIASVIAQPFSTDNQIQKEMAKVIELEKQLNNPALTESTRAIIQEQFDIKSGGVIHLLESKIKDIESMPDKHFQEIMSLEKNQIEIKNKVKDINTDENLGETERKEVLKGLKEKFDANNQRRIDLIERGSSAQLMELEDSEIIRLKDVAQRQLMKELNPDGTKSISIDDIEISKRAGQILSNEIKSSKTLNFNISEKENKEFSVIGKDGNGKTVSEVSISNLGNGRFEIENSQVNEELQNKGIGTKTYEKMINEANNRGIEIYSDPKGLTIQAEKVWEKLVKNGKAVKIGEKPGDSEWTDRTDNIGLFRTVYEESVLKKKLRDMGVSQKLIDAVPNNVTSKESLFIKSKDAFLQIIEGSYSPSKSEINISKIGNLFSDKNQTLLHEVVHAGTYFAFADILENPKNYTKSQYDSASELNDIAKAYMENTSDGAKSIFTTLYGTTNPLEFMAEFVSNKKFRDYVGKNSQDKNVNILDHIWSRIISMLGISKSKIDTEKISNISAMIDSVLEASAKINNNETASQGNPSTDGSIQSGTSVLENTGTPVEENIEGEELREAVEPTASQENAEVKPISVGNFNYQFSNGEWKSTDKDGNPKPESKGKRTVRTNDGKVLEKEVTNNPIPKKVLDLHAESFDFSQGKKAIDERKINDVSTWEEDVAEHSESPIEVAETILGLKATDASEFLDTKSKAIAEAIGSKTVERDSFNRSGDRNAITQSIALQYFAKKGKGQGIDDIAMAAEVSIYGDYDAANPKVTEQDVIDFILDNPGGTQRFFNSAKNAKMESLKLAFESLTGLPANDKYLGKAIQQAKSKEEFLNNYATELDLLLDEQLLSLQNETQLSEKEFYDTEKNNTNGNGEGSGKVENSEKGPERSAVQSESGQNDRGSEESTNDDGITEQSSTQDRTSALVSERIKPERRTPVNSPKKLNQIIKDVATGLKSTLIYGRSGRRNSLGTYNSTNTLVRITRAGDIDTVAHELGHYLDDKFNLLGTVPSVSELNIIRQLKWFSDRGGSNPPSQLSPAKKAEYLEREGLAEFIRAYVSNPSQSLAIAPELTSHFENTVDAETLSVIKKFSDDFLDYANASYSEQITANIEDSNLPNKNGFKEWLNRFKKEDGKFGITPFDSFTTQMLNSMHISQKAFSFLTDMAGFSDLLPEKNFELLSRVFAGINGKVNRMLVSGLTNSKNEALKDSEGNAMNVKWLIDGLDSSSEKTIREDMDDVIRLLVAERTFEYAKKFGRLNNLTGIGAGVNSDISVAEGFLNDFRGLENSNNEKFLRITEGARKYREFADAGLRYSVEKGRLSEEQYQQIKESNQFYVSLARTKENAPMEESLGFVNPSAGNLSSVKDVFKKAKGGSDMIQNPYTSLMKNTVAIIRESDRNEVMQSFIEPLKSLRHMGDGTPLDYAQIARLSKTGDKNTRTIYVNGEKQVWQFQQDIYNSLTSLDAVAKNPIIDILALPGSLIRFTVTNFPTFALRNASRDTVSRLLVSRTGGGLSDLIHNATDKEVYEMYGGSQAGFYLVDKKSYEDTLTMAVKEITAKGGIVLNPMKIGKGYRKLLESGENLNRVAEFKSALRKAKKEGMDDYNAGLYAAYQARDLMDFAVAGHVMRVINRIVPFSNAGVQGLRRTAKSIKETPGAFAVRTALYTVLPTIVFRAMVSQMGDDDEYEELPSHQRDLFWNFKTPFTGDSWITIPKPFEQGMTSSFVDRMISKSQGVKTSFDGFSGSLLKTLMPFDEASMMGGLKPIFEASVNYNMFTDRPIVSPWEEEKLMDLRKGNKDASRISQTLSNGFDQVGWSVDPRKVDHVIKGYGTYMADWGLSIGDIGVEDTRFGFKPSKTGFAKDVPMSNAVSVNAVYKLASELDKWRNPKIKGMRNDIEDFMNSKDAAVRKELSKNIYEKAREIRKELEKEKVIIERFSKKEIEIKEDLQKFVDNKDKSNPEYSEMKEKLKQLKKEKIEFEEKMEE